MDKNNLILRWTKMNRDGQRWTMMANMDEDEYKSTKMNKNGK